MLTYQEKLFFFFLKGSDWCKGELKYLYKIEEWKIMSWICRGQCETCWYFKSLKKIPYTPKCINHFQTEMNLGKIASWRTKHLRHSSPDLTKWQILKQLQSCKNNWLWHVPRLGGWAGNTSHNLEIND